MQQQQQARVVLDFQLANQKQKRISKGEYIDAYLPHQGRVYCIQVNVIEWRLYYVACIQGRKKSR